MPYDTLKLSAPTPILSWAGHPLESQEMQMAKNMATLPFVFKHIALMPDVHLGKGALVGSVIATKEAIIPAAVGVDIGCGMIALKMPFQGKQLEGKLKKIRLEIEAAIPVGFEENKETDKAVSNWQQWNSYKILHRGVQDLEGKAMRQLGSLGGGNHFIELCLDTENNVWLMLHSGSRNIGNKLAQCHISTAKQLAKMAGQSLNDPDLAHFVAGTPEFKAYWHDLQWAQDYAHFNREVMMSRFKRIVEQHLAGGKPTKPLLEVNCHHNYAEKEVHFGELVYVTRKGAVRATTEDYGIIPGSMGTKSYIVKGKGNLESYCSCFARGTMVLTEYGLMTIEDIFNSPNPPKLVSYNQDLKKFEVKEILDKSERLAQVNHYSISQTGRRLENTIACTLNHPFATYEQGVLSYFPVENIALSSGGVIIPTSIKLESNKNTEGQDTDLYYLLGLILSDGTIHYRVRDLVSNLPAILMTNSDLALSFLAGYLDGDGTYGRGAVAISVGKRKMFSYLVCALLSLGVAYKVYKNRNNYSLEFRDNNTLNKLRAICKRLVIEEPTERIFADKLVLAQSVVGGVKCENLNTIAKQGKMVDIAKFKNQSLDPALAMNRIFKTPSSQEILVYNFTVEDNNNYIVFTDYYTPVLVHNCSHGAGRRMSRGKAKELFSLDDLLEQTSGVECRKDRGIIDEIPGAYKDIDQVMQQQSDLVEIVATLKQVLCVKG